VRQCAAACEEDKAMRARKLWTKVSAPLALALLLMLLVAAVAAAPGWASPLSPTGQGDLVQGLDSIPSVADNTVFVPFTIRQGGVIQNRWQAEYYNNATLANPPAYTREETRVDYDWEDDSGPSGLNKDYFSIRWTGDWAFEVGEYTFFAYADDGVRLWLDGQLLIDAWAAGQGPHEETFLIATAGLHRLKLEYFERTGYAAIRLHWRRTDLYPLWEGRYYANDAWTHGTAAYTQDDPAIQFDWGEGCPDGLSCNRFSIAWEATPVFEIGTHRIHLYADEGYQLFVDGHEVKHGGWDLGDPGGAQDDYYDLEVDALEYREIGLNFHDQGGTAEARLWIEHIEHPDWTAEYYSNTSFAGAPVVTHDETAVFHDWGEGKARPKMPSADNFSVRWSGQRYFHSGAYRFFVFADDGVRLYVDGERLINEWHAGRSDYNSLVTYLTTGYHEVKIEYYDSSGTAEIRFWWE